MALYPRVYHNLCHLVVGYFYFDVAGELLVCGKAELDSSLHGFSRKLEKSCSYHFRGDGNRARSERDGQSPSLSILLVECRASPPGPDGRDTRPSILSECRIAPDEAPDLISQ